MLHKQTLLAILVSKKGDHSAWLAQRQVPFSKPILAGLHIRLVAIHGMLMAKVAQLAVACQTAHVC